MASFWESPVGTFISNLLPTQGIIDALKNTEFAPSASNPFVTLQKLISVFLSVGHYAGQHDASGGTVPTTGTGTAGAIRADDYWRVKVAGTIIGIEGASENLEIGDVIYASIANATNPSDFFAQQGNQDFASKADKDTDAVAGNLSEFDEFGNPVDTGVPTSTIANKANKVANPTSGNLLETDANGHPVDTGIPKTTIANKVDKDYTAITDEIMISDGAGGMTGSGRDIEELDYYAIADIGGVEGNICELDAEGNSIDSGIAKDDVLAKEGATTEGNLTMFNANGKVVDTGINYLYLLINQDKEQSEIELLANEDNDIDTLQSVQKPRLTGIEYVDPSDNLPYDIWKEVQVSYVLNGTWKIRIRTGIPYDGVKIYYKETPNVQDKILSVPVVFGSNTYDTGQAAVKPRVTGVEYTDQNNVTFDIWKEVMISYELNTNWKIHLYSSTPYNNIKIHYKL